MTIPSIARRKSLLYPNMNMSTSVTMYPGISSGIDLRLYMDEILYSYGHWVMIRHYDTSIRSEYWNDETKESVGGPPHPYNDYIVRSRKVLQSTGGTLSAMEMPTPFGIVHVPYVTYYLKWNSIGTPLDNKDEIYEFPWMSDRAPGTDEVIDIVNRKYNILESVDLLGDSGRLEYYACICEADKVGW